MSSCVASGQLGAAAIVKLLFPRANDVRTVSKLGDGGSNSSLSCRRRKGGVEKKPPIDIEGPRSKEDWAVVAADVEADVSEVISKSRILKGEHNEGVLFCV